MRTNAKSRRVQLLINLTEQHRSLWLRPFENPGLHRILEEKVNLEKNPPTLEEKIFLNLVFLHLSTVVQAFREETIEKPDGIEADLRELLKLPLPQYVWMKSRQYRDHEINDFVEAVVCEAEAGLFQNSEESICFKPRGF